MYMYLVLVSASRKSFSQSPQDFIAWDHTTSSTLSVPSRIHRLPEFKNEVKIKFSGNDQSANLTRSGILQCHIRSDDLPPKGIDRSAAQKW